MARCGDVIWQDSARGRDARRLGGVGGRLYGSLRGMRGGMRGL